jgi:hypothetical protein
MSEKFSPSHEKMSPSEKRAELEKVFQNEIQQWAGSEQDVQFYTDRVASADENDPAIQRSKDALKQTIEQAENLADHLIETYDQLIKLTPDEDKHALREKMMNVVGTIVEVERDEEIAERFKEIYFAIEKENQAQLKRRAETDQEMSSRIAQDYFHKQAENTDDPNVIHDVKNFLAGITEDPTQEPQENDDWNWDSFGESPAVPQVTMVAEPSQKHHIPVEQPTREQLIQNLREEIQQGTKRPSNPPTSVRTPNPLESKPEAPLPNN